MVCVIQIKISEFQNILSFIPYHPWCEMFYKEFIVMKLEVEN